MEGVRLTYGKWSARVDSCVQANHGAASHLNVDKSTPEDIVLNGLLSSGSP